MTSFIKKINNLLIKSIKVLPDKKTITILVKRAIIAFTKA